MAKKPQAGSETSHQERSSDNDQESDNNDNNSIEMIFNDIMYNDSVSLNNDNENVIDDYNSIGMISNDNLQNVSISLNKKNDLENDNLQNFSLLELNINHELANFTQMSNIDDNFKMRSQPLLF